MPRPRESRPAGPVVGGDVGLVAEVGSSAPFKLVARPENDVSDVSAQAADSTGFFLSSRVKNCEKCKSRSDFLFSMYTKMESTCGICPEVT